VPTGAQDGDEPRRQDGVAGQVHAVGHRWEHLVPVEPGEGVVDDVAHNEQREPGRQHVPGRGGAGPMAADAPQHGGENVQLDGVVRGFVPPLGYDERVGNDGQHTDREHDPVRSARHKVNVGIFGTEREGRSPLGPY
jgi:hypothetical protein